MVETIATYWEKQIKVYGISDLPDQTLLRITCPASKISGWGTHFEQLQEVCGRFEIISTQPVSDSSFLINMVINGQQVAQIIERLNIIVDDEINTTLSLVSPVALVFLHGPHFQDRFGIAHALYRALEEAKADILFCGCSGTSVYIVIPEHDRKRTISTVRKTFLVPGAR